MDGAETLPRTAALAAIGLCIVLTWVLFGVGITLYRNSQDAVVDRICTKVNDVRGDVFSLAELARLKGAELPPEFFEKAKTFEEPVDCK